MASFPRKQDCRASSVIYRKPKTSRVNITSTQRHTNLSVSQMGRTWRLPSPTRSSWQQSPWWLDCSPAKRTPNKLPNKTHTLTYGLCPSAVCRWKNCIAKFQWFCWLVHILLKSVCELLLLHSLLNQSLQYLITLNLNFWRLCSSCVPYLSLKSHQVPHRSSSERQQQLRHSPTAQSKQSKGFS